MSKSRALGGLLFTALFLSSFGYAASSDRIVGDLTAGPKVALYAGASAPYRPGQDIGRAYANRQIEGVSLDFRMSPAQQKDLSQFLAELGQKSSPNYHKYLTPAKYAERFGMSQNDLDKVVAWLQSEGFTNIKVATTRNHVTFTGTVSQIESLFAIEMHNYLVDGVVHLANATSPSLPAPLAGIVVHIGHLNDFAPRPRIKTQPHFTSYVSGNHFLTPADFATIYDLKNLGTGSGQSIAIVGQSTVNTSDLNNFRSAAGLPASTVTMRSIEGTPTRCSGDEGESDLDLEWSGGVASGAQITFVYAGLGPGDSCTGNRADNVWDAIQYALENATAPFVSTSYGYCEALLQSEDPGFPSQVQGWVQTGQSLGVTLTSASGDSGAADCDNDNSATQGYAVDVPASIPETTGAGGSEFSADSQTNTPPGGDPPYWAAAGGSSDTISSALEYIPEEGWNDTTVSLEQNPPEGLVASGGGASTLFLVPSWQNVTGVPSGTTKRLVPDIALNASPFHDPYLFCSEDDGSGGTTATCTDGFRTGAGGELTAVGGTSAVAPTFSAILALINQYLGNTPPTGLAPVNVTLYGLYPNNSTTGAFHDITTGTNMVPCTTGTTDCPSGTTEIGFSAGVGYDQVTGLGSVDGFKLAQAWQASLSSFSVAAGSLSPASVAAGTSTTTTITVAPTNGTPGTVTFSCSNLPSGATCAFNPTSVNNGTGTTTLTISTAANMAAGTTSVTVTGTSGGEKATAAVSLVVTATAESFQLSSSIAGGTLTVTQGQTGTVNYTVTSTSTPSFITNNQTNVAVTYTCSGLPTESTCVFSPTSPSSATSLTLTIQTTAPTSKLQRPFDRGMKIFYAIFLPGVLGLVFMRGSRRLRGVQIVCMIVVLGFSTLWMASCSSGGGGGGTSNPGTPLGNSSIVVNATTGGGNAITSTLSFTLTVSQ